MPDKNDKNKTNDKKHPNVIARQMPNSYDAEGALIGSMLVDAQTAVKYIPLLGENDFYTPAHRLIFTAMRELFALSQPIDVVTLINKLDDLGTLEMSGGVDYISGLVNVIPSISNAQYYFGIVQKHTKLRELIRIAQIMADDAYALDPDESAIAKAETELYNLGEKGSRTKLIPIAGAINEALDDLKKRQENVDAYRGVPTGFPFLDTKLGGGFQKSDLIILAARPGQGKTSFAMNCAVNAALSIRPDTKQHYAVAVFSLEMSAVQLAKRILCSVGNFSMTTAGKAMMTERDWDKLYEARSRLVNTRLYVDESGQVTPAEIVSKCRALKHTVGLDFVMIDYLQLMTSGRRVDNIVREIAEITRALKLAAKELDVPILLLSQMSRDIDKRKDPTPQLSDLRDSGAIEQDADIVMFLDRTKKKDEVEDPADTAATVDSNTVWLNIAKHRNGETGNVRLIWVPSIVSFRCPGGDDSVAPGKYTGTSPSAFIDNGDELAPPDGVDPDDVGF